MLMSGNQSFNQSLYAPLTRLPLACRPAVYFKRKVYMNRRPIVGGMISAGVMVQLALLLCTAPIHAQTATDAPPGMENGAGPFSGGSHGPTTFGGRQAAPDKPAVSTFPGEVHGVTRYPSGLPMPEAEVTIVNGDTNVDRTMLSGSDGSFVFKNLKPGEYQLTARKDGFALSPITKVELATGKIATVDVPLGPSLAVSPINMDSAGLTRTLHAPAYRVEPASLHLGPAETGADDTVRSSESAPSAASQPAASPAEQPIPAAVADELAAMRKRIDELESELKGRAATNQPVLETSTEETPVAAAAPQDAQAAPTPKPGPGQYLATGGTITYFKGDTDIPDHPAGFDPFSYADYTWLNGGGRQHDSPWSTKYFTPEFRADVNFSDDFDHPRDDSLGGSTETFRSNEWQLEQMSLGGDIRIGHVRGRILTMFGMFSTTTPRNDGSVSRGQWDLANAYRYISEGWGGYHFDNIGHGLNIDAGIFVSYIGLFSYYNFDNWAYQPSYVSSNTPWFFNGLRIQYFPTGKLKIEPWIINGWQSYARFNSKPGLGGQILWRPEPWLSFVFNNYGMGTDVLGSPATSRIHTDDSVEVREFLHPDSFFDQAAMSFTGDLGCQYGGGQNCFNDKNSGIKTAFLGWMAYERLQFKHDLYGITLGGGMMSNPGRYLTLIPPINGANGITGTPYFTENLGDKAHMYDSTVTFDYMPSQWLTFRAEMGYRHSDVPYWSGRGGLTPPNGNNAFANTGSPASYVCTNGVTSVVSDFAPSGAGFYESSSVTPLGDNLGPQNSGGPVDRSCAAQMGSSSWHAWAPDLRHSQIVATFAIMTRF